MKHVHAQLYAKAYNFLVAAGLDAFYGEVADVHRLIAERFDKPDERLERNACYLLVNDYRGLKGLPPAKNPEARISPLKVLNKPKKKRAKKPKLHACPYKEDVNNDHETLCDCDEDTVRACLEDI